MLVDLKSRIRDVARKTRKTGELYMTNIGLLRITASAAAFALLWTAQWAVAAPRLTSPPAMKMHRARKSGTGHARSQSRIAAEAAVPATVVTTPITANVTVTDSSCECRQGHGQLAAAWPHL